MPSEYPSTVIEVLNDRMRFKPAALQAVRNFARSRPWRGTLKERKGKFRRLNRALSATYDIDEPELLFRQIHGTYSGGSHFIPSQYRIVITGKMSVVTFLHEFAHARGLDEQSACRWSINLFRRMFPAQFGRLLQVGHTLIRPQELVQRIENHG